MEGGVRLRLEGKAAIVTGAARGIGLACAERLAGDGASVLLTDVLDEEGAAATEALSRDGATAVYEHLDVTEEPGWERVIARALDTFGRLDVLVNNAGIGTLEDVEQETVDGWERTTAINQRGVWLGMKHAGPAMKTSGGGSIVNMSSIFGAVGGFGGSIAYHASKGAVRLMTKNAALRWATEGVRVNSVHPGFIETPMIAVGDDAFTDAMVGSTPMGRLGQPEEIAAVVAFLGSDEASYMTGSEVYVDGGYTAR